MATQVCTKDEKEKLIAVTKSQWAESVGTLEPKKLIKLLKEQHFLQKGRPGVGLPYGKSAQLLSLCCCLLPSWHI